MCVDLLVGEFHEPRHVLPDPLAGGLHEPRHVLPDPLAGGLHEPRHVLPDLPGPDGGGHLPDIRAGGAGTPRSYLVPRAPGTQCAQCTLIGTYR